MKEWSFTFRPPLIFVIDDVVKPMTRRQWWPQIAQLVWIKKKTNDPVTLNRIAERLIPSLNIAKRIVIWLYLAWTWSTVLRSACQKFVRKHALSLNLNLIRTDCRRDKIEMDVFGTVYERTISVL